MPQELAEQVRPPGLQRKWRGRGRGRRHILAAEAQGVQPETLRILTEGMEVMEERTYVGAASAMVARLPPRTPTRSGGSSGSAQGSKQPPPAPSSEVVFAEVADNSDQEVNQDVALVQALQANFVTFTDEVEAAQRAARVPKQPAMRRPAGGSLWYD